jgi:glycosyltransferase involved in cell wall biosynthesis
MNRRPLVSCVCTFLNAEPFFRETLESVLAQDFSDWELLLIDDGSTDQSTAVAKEYEERYPDKVRYFAHPQRQNLGVSASRNLGIARSRGAYVAFLDADDVWLPHKLSQQEAILRSHPSAAMVYGRVQLWHSWQQPPTCRDSFMSLGVASDRILLPPQLLVVLLLAKAQTPVPSNTMIRRDVLDQIGDFEETLRVFEDQELFARVFLEHPVYVSGKCWVRYRQHPQSASAFLADFAANIPRYCSTKLAFLDKLASYLSARRIRNPMIWLPLLKERWFCKHPYLLERWFLLKHPESKAAPRG